MALSEAPRFAIRGRPVVNFQADLGLGNISYLVWWDWFNLSSMVMLLAVLILAIYEHTLLNAGDTSSATIFNKTFRVVVLAAVYPILLGCFIAFGVGAYTPGVAEVATVVLIVGTTACVFAASVMYRRSVRAETAAREDMSTAVRTADTGHGGFARKMQGVFEAYDEDDDGRIDPVEMRRMLKASFGPATSTGLGMLEINALCKAFSTDVEITLDVFLDTMPDVIAKAREMSKNSLARETSTNTIASAMATNAYENAMELESAVEKPAASI